MGEITIGGVAYDLHPYVVEAIVHFRFVRLKAAAWLTTELTATFNRDVGRSIREGGTRITPDERIAMGLHRWEGGHLSREVWAALTEAGRADPVEHFDATCARAGKRLRSKAQHERHQRAAGICVGVKFNAGTSSYPPCAVAAPLDGMFLGEPVLLPLAECDQLRCACGWRGVTAREMRGEA